MIFGKRENTSTLDDVLNSSWRILHNGVRNFRHPVKKGKHLDDQVKMFVDFTYKPMLFYDGAMSEWKGKATEVKQ